MHGKHPSILATSAVVLALAACAPTTGRAPRANADSDHPASNSCAGVPEPERDGSPFANRAVIEAVAEVSEEEGGKLPHRRLRGAQVIIAATPGVTRPWLSRLIHCHVMRRSADAIPEDPSNPLDVGRPAVTVTETETGFAVAIRGRNDEEAREIVRRAQGLAR